MFSRDQVHPAMRTVHAAMPPTPHYAWPMLRQHAIGLAADRGLHMVPSFHTELFASVLSAG